MSETIDNMSLDCPLKKKEQIHEFVTVFELITEMIVIYQRQQFKEIRLRGINYDLEFPLLVLSVQHGPHTQRRYIGRLFQTIQMKTF
jgi:hypothetical protein